MHDIVVKLEVNFYIVTWTENKLPWVVLLLDNVIVATMTMCIRTDFGGEYNIEDIIILIICFTVLILTLVCET